MATKQELEKELADKDSALKQMQEQMQQMMEQMQQLASQSKTVVINQEQTKEVDLQNKKIKIISLIGNPLNLSTELGRKYPLEYYGHSRMIRYDDLESIVAKHSRFIDCFYICDKDAVRELGLEEEYEKMVDKNSMDKIANLEDDIAVEMFKGLSPKLQDNATDMIVEKLVAGQAFDENKIYAINQYTGKDLRKIAEDRKILLKK